ncbi:MAG: diadenylate cyclase [Chitinispirillaceae bacterium]|nr:diadenylate cyclase [Chitinispirillaceae bacterium]
MKKTYGSPSQQRTLIDAYEQVLPDLSHIIGYPAKLTRITVHASPWPREPEKDKERVRFFLPGPENRTSIASLSFPLEADQDAFAKKCIERFIRFSERLGKAVKTVNDVRRILVEDEPLLWDDIIVSATYSDSSEKLNVLTLIAAARDALYMRYEGEPLDQGLLLTWEPSRLKEASGNEYDLLPFARDTDYREALKQSRKISKLADGENSLIVVDGDGRMKYLLRFCDPFPMTDIAGWEMVPHRYRHLKSVLLGKDLILIATSHGELIVFNTAGVMKLTGNMWHRVTGTPVSYYLRDHLSIGASQRLSEILVEMSAAKIGASFVITKRPEHFVGKRLKGLAREFRCASFGNVRRISRKALIRLASIDGCIVIGADGEVLNAGVILNIPERYTKGEEGARAAATRYGSTFGLGIKVSHDGPITVYENGAPVRHIA